jgi:ATP-dependent DNA helicase UvrD/PcrA
MTRAKDELALVVPQRFYVHGQPRYGDRAVYAGRTRFLPPALLKHFDRQTWPAAEPEPRRAASDGPRVDLQARMRAMWR